MGHTRENLAFREIGNKAIFSNRFVIEIAEKVHIHYRNLRILLSVQDWIEFCKGCQDALIRWNQRGCPEPKEGVHIELCRKKVATEAHNDGIKINLNDNLYLPNEGKIFAEGADFKDKTYIHLKIRDTRIELSIDEFKTLAEAVKEADARL
jgi:hypothetical protein